MSEAEEYAKAVQSVADFGTKSLDLSEKIGGFFAQVFKEPFQEVSGMITDRLKFIRWRRLVQMGDEVNKILLEKGVKETRGVSPKLALPIFEESSLEDDPSLQYLWNHLLANAMDPKFNGELRYGFIDMIKNITGIEASILNKFYELLKVNDNKIDINKITKFTLTNQQIMKMVGIDAITYQVSIYNLMRTQCIGPAFSIMPVLDKFEPVATYEEPKAFVLTPLGLRFVEACIR
jgi:hypothetical protein